MRSAFLAPTLTLALTLALAAGAAQAADFVVVRSSDPAIKPGLTLDGGQQVSLAAGQTLVLMAGGGTVTTLRGGPAGATAPKLTQGDATRVNALRAILDPPPPGRTFGGRRNVCPDPATLGSLDDIIAVQAAGCGDSARAALQALADKSSD